MGEDRISRSDREIYAMTSHSRLMRRLDEQDAARKRRPPPADLVEQPAPRPKRGPGGAGAEVRRRQSAPPATAISSHNPDCAKIVPIAPMTLENR